LFIQPVFEVALGDNVARVDLEARVVARVPPGQLQSPFESVERAGVRRRPVGHRFFFEHWSRIQPFIIKILNAELYFLYPFRPCFALDR